MELLIPVVGVIVLGMVLTRFLGMWNGDRPKEKLDPHPLNVNRYCDYAWKAYEREDYEVAIEFCNTALETNPRSTQALRIRAQALMEQKEYERALVDIHRAIEVASDWGNYYRIRAEIYRELNEPEKAVADYTRALELDPESTELTLPGRLYVYHFMLGQHNLALRDIEALFPIITDEHLRLSLHYIRSSVRRSLGDRAGAVTDLDYVLTVEPDNIGALDSQAWDYYSLKQYEAALKDADHALSLPDAERFRQSIVLCRGLALLRLKRWDEADTALQQAVDLAPEDKKPVELLNLAYLRGFQGRFEDALALYDRIIEGKPDNWLAWNNRGYEQAAVGRLDNGLADCEKALELKPDDCNPHSTKGYILFLRGDFVQALADFVKSTELKSDHPFAIAGQAITQHALGNVDEARKLWQKLIELDSRYATVDALIEDYHPAEAFVNEARKIIAELE